MSFSIVSRSAVQTRKWGEKLGKLLRGGEIVGLTGELGSGKTCFVRGMAEGLEVPRGAWIRSPSFTLINEYHGRLPIFHVDLYRVESGREMEELNLREYLFSEGVSIVEWFEHLSSEEVEDYFHVEFFHTGRSKRKLNFTAHGNRYEEIIEELKNIGVKGKDRIQKSDSRSQNSEEEGDSGV